MPDTDTTSPCRSKCLLDDTRSFCLGCRRTLAEIASWSSLGAQERQSVMSSLADRTDDRLREMADADLQARRAARRGRRRR